MGPRRQTPSLQPSYQQLPKKGFAETRKSLLEMFGSVNKLAALDVRWQRDRLVWISKQKIVELDQDRSDKMLHKAVLVRNTDSALTTWKGEERERTSAFAFRL